MPCYYPLLGYRSREVNSSGKVSIVFNPNDGYSDFPVKLPCGQCVGCRIERSRQWAIRCVHEASLHEDNCFITLTYNDENLPKDGSLNSRDFQLFMKKLRIKLAREYDIPCGVRFYHCGEYGEVCANCGLSKIMCSKNGCGKFKPTLGRPHHHAILFGYDFKDKYHWSTKRGIRLYRSDFLESVWTQGHSTVGAVTFESAAYVARYIMKKQNGDMAAERYKGKKPEFTTMSRRPGIAKTWFERFQGDVYPNDYVVIRNGIKCRPPKYYDSIFDIEYPEKFKKVKAKRNKEAFKMSKHDDNSLERLAVREKVKLTQLKQLKRGVEENGNEYL